MTRTVQWRTSSSRPPATLRSPAARPRSSYELAAEIRPDWSGVHVWFGDDRAVPPDDELSNYRLAKETLLDRLNVQPEVHRIRGELGAEKAAGLYDAELEGVTLDLALTASAPTGTPPRSTRAPRPWTRGGGVRWPQRPSGSPSFRA